MYWQNFAPDATSRTKPAFNATDPSAYHQANWSTFDTIDRDAAHDGLTIYLTLMGPAPLWAATPGAPASDKQPGYWKPKAADYREFVEAVGKRYDGSYTPPGQSAPLPRINFWSLWNEPNYGVNLAPQITGSNQAVSPLFYRRLVDAGWQGLEASGHTTSRDTVLIGETAPRGFADPTLQGQGITPLRFIEGLYCVGSDFKPLTGSAATELGCPSAGGRSAFVTDNPPLFDATGWADHPYPDTFPPTVKTPPPTGTGYADFAALGDLSPTLDGAFTAYGQHRLLPIYSTEFGYKTMPPGNAEDAVSLRDAAAWLNQSEYLSWSSSRIRSYDQYLMDDPNPAQSQFFTGVATDTGQPKPDVYDAYRVPLWLPTTSGAGAGPQLVWGCARPANTGGPKRVEIQFAPSGGRFHTVKTVMLSSADGCYFKVPVRFSGGGSVRLAYPDGSTTDYSRTQAITAK